MTIATGQSLPEATFTEMNDSGVQQVPSADIFKGRKVVLFGLPGAYTGTCSTQHVPSFMRTAKAFGDKGVDAIVCVSVNDPFVMDAWGKATGAVEGGLRFVADAGGDFTRALGLDFDAPPVGLHGRSKRYAMLVEDGVVKVLNIENSPGECEISAGETLLAAL